MGLRPFPAPPNQTDLALLAPEWVLLGGGCLVLVIQMIWGRTSRGGPWAGWAAILIHVLSLGALTFPAAALAAVSEDAVAPPFFAPLEGALTGFHGNVVVDPFGLCLRAVVLTGSLLTLVLALRYSDRFRNPGEFFALIVLVAGAASLLVVAADLIMIYLCVEFLSIGSYVLVGYLKFQARSTEAALKYFLFGAASAAVMLYGMSLLYGLAGSTSLYALAEDQRVSVVTGVSAALGQEGGPGVVLVCLALLVIGFGFKVGMAPVHQWVPDVYDGAPLPVMAWLSVVSKAAGLAVMLRVLALGFPGQLWSFPMAVLAAATMTAGNLGALTQTSVKRLLAFSSVAHAGYTLMAVASLGAGTAAGGNSSWQQLGAVSYLAIYVFMNLGALAVVFAVYETTRSHRLDAYAGLAQRSPLLAWLMLFYLVSLAGIPPTAGFWAKFVLFTATLQAPGLGWLAVMALVNTVISVFYYWRLVQAMFLRAPTDPEPIRTDPGVRFTLAMTALMVLGIFLFAGPFMNLLGSG